MTISETIPKVEVPTGDPKIPELFPEVKILRLCTANVCMQGHEWIPKVALARCGYGTPQGWNGCGAPILMVKQENCPVCNEPVVKMRIRTDHTPPTQFAIPMCIPGSVSHADIAEVVLTRDSRETEKQYDLKFPPIAVPDAPVEPQGEI